jgi:hypothetical protein
MGHGYIVIIRDKACGSLKMKQLRFCVFSGYNISGRRKQTSKIGSPHRLNKEDAMKWFQTKVSYPFFSSQT